MNGVHDLGGMHGFGPIVREVDEPIFHAAWEAHVRAMMRLGIEQGYFNIDAFRHGIERMAPADYLRASYYERWLHSVERNLIAAGLVTAEEVEARLALLRGDPAAAPRAAAGAPSPRPAPAPGSLATAPPARFAIGDAVVTRNVHPTGHTRLPRYARGKRGVVQRIHGPQIFPDTNAHGLGEQPQVLYSVRFTAEELWGESAEARQTVAIDLWESYLEPDPPVAG